MISKIKYLEKLHERDVLLASLNTIQNECEMLAKRTGQFQERSRIIHIIRNHDDYDTLIDEIMKSHD